MCDDQMVLTVHYPLLHGSVPRHHTIGTTALYRAYYDVTDADPTNMAGVMLQYLRSRRHVPRAAQESRRCSRRQPRAGRALLSLQLRHAPRVDDMG
jgi:hypothetical protein